MGPIQGIPVNQANQILNNDIYGPADGNCSSSYVSSSGIKSVLLNAWNTVKSAVSGMLSSFGLHLCGQQGSNKPGREMIIDMSSRPAHPLPDIDAKFDNPVYESCGKNSYDSADIYTGSGRPESLYSDVDIKALIREPSPPPLPDSPRPSLSGSSESLYSEIDIDESLYEVTEISQVPPPVPDSPRPSLSRLSGSEAKSEAMGSVYESSGKNVYTSPYDSGNTISTPKNDPREESDYADPRELQFDHTKFLQQISNNRLKMQ